MESFYFTAFGMVFCILLMIIYFSKKKIDSLENKTYGYIVLVTFLSCLAETYSFILVRNNVNPYSFNYLLSLKLLFSCFFAWIYFFTMYIILVTVGDNKKEGKIKQLMKNYILLFLLIIAIDVFFLPINVTKVGEMLLPSGMAVNLIYACVVICIGVMIVIFLKNVKNVNNKKFIPLYLLIASFGLMVLIQKLIPNLLIINGAFVFITFVMYFTIENPDVKIIDELNKNRILINKTTEEKSNFLFLTANQLKNPIKNLQTISKEAIEIKNIDEIKERLKEINNVTQNLSILVNNILDISSLTNSNIKMVQEKYNLSNLIQKVKLLEEKKINNNIEFRVNKSDTIPKYLYGDSKLLEQILISILENSIKYTKEGFIELRINTIIKYDMARLIFTIEDSGLGMSTSKVNELLLTDSELNEEEIKRLETNNVNMNTIKKLVSKLGGYFTIKSEVGKGTEVKVVVDQRIELDNNINLKNVSTNQKILLASSNNDLSNQMLKILNKRGYSIDTSTYSNDILDRVRLNDNYSYIFIDDAMDKRAIEILKKLKTIPEFNTKVVVIIDKSLDLVKNDLIKDGFYDCIFKEDINKELERILD